MNETPCAAPLQDDDPPAVGRAAAERRAPDTRFASLYPALCRLARARLRRESTFTLLDTRALVHESFLRIAARGHVAPDERAAFWGYASKVMRSVIVDHARARLTQRRGEHAEHVALDTALGERLPAPETRIVQVDDALRMLERAEPRLAQVVELQYFGGFTDAEIAESLGVSERTVRRDWEKARLLLQVALGPSA